MAIVMMTKLTAQEGKRDELVAALSTLVAHAAHEPGTEVYALHTALDDADTVWFYERFTDKDALKAHSTTDAAKAVFGSLGALLAGPAEMIKLADVAAKGI
jgi:quinol monooxygenase YgiN